MITFPNAKINLGLNITGKRPDGYHNLKTVFYPIPLEDALEITPSANGNNKFTLRSSGIAIGGEPENNLVARAYRILDERFDLPPVNVCLYKHIPSGAGLGGGSSDAAFMLQSLNDLFSLNLSTGELEHYAAGLGADCAFFIRNRPAFAEGIGNVFSPVSPLLKDYRLVVVKPGVSVSTKAAFAYIKPRKPEYPLKEIVSLAVTEWKGRMTNDFEESVFPQYPEIGEIKERLYQEGAVYASMSGSGSSVFGLFPSGKTVPPVTSFPNCFYFKHELK